MARARILVVEDEGIVAIDIQNRLKRLGYDVPAVASYGEEAVRKAAEIHPDLVLMDIMLTGEMDGIEAAQQIWDRFDIPVVYLTAYSDELTLQRAKVTAPFGYIVKPFEDRELHISLEIALYKHDIERKLRDSEEKYRDLVETANIIILRMDTSGYITFFNEFAQEFFDYDEEEILGKNIVGTIVQDIRSNGHDQGMTIAKIISNPDGYANSINECVRRNGERVWISWTTQPIRDEEGQIKEIQCIGNDITDRMKAEERLRKSEEQYRTVFEIAPDLIFSLSANDGTITSLNPAFERLTGWSHNEWLGRSFKKLVHPDDLPRGQRDVEANIERRESNPG